MLLYIIALVLYVTPTTDVYDRSHETETVIFLSEPTMVCTATRKAPIQVSLLNPDSYEISFSPFRMPILIWLGSMGDRRRAEGGSRHPAPRNSLPRKNCDVSLPFRLSDKLKLFICYLILTMISLKRFTALAVSFLLLPALGDALDAFTENARFSNESLLWGPYRPNLYFGVRPRIPKSLTTGLLWARVDSFETVQNSMHHLIAIF